VVVKMATPNGAAASGSRYHNGATHDSSRLSIIAYDAIAVPSRNARSRRERDG
jgi:hypothetical protein